MRISRGILLACLPLALTACSGSGDGAVPEPTSSSSSTSIPPQFDYDANRYSIFPTKNGAPTERPRATLKPGAMPAEAPEAARHPKEPGSGNSDDAEGTPRCREVDAAKDADRSKAMYECLKSGAAGSYRSLTVTSGGLTVFTEETSKPWAEAQWQSDGLAFVNPGKEKSGAYRMAGGEKWREDPGGKGMTDEERHKFAFPQRFTAWPFEECTDWEVEKHTDQSRTFHCAMPDDETTRIDATFDKKMRPLLFRAEVEDMTGKRVTVEQRWWDLGVQHDIPVPQR